MDPISLDKLLSIADEIEEYFAFRIIIEDFVLSLVIQRITNNELQSLRENLKKAEKYYKKAMIHWKRNNIISLCFI